MGDDAEYRLRVLWKYRVIHGEYQTGVPATPTRTGPNTMRNHAAGTTEISG